MRPLTLTLLTSLTLACSFDASGISDSSGTGGVGGSSSSGEPPASGTSSTGEPEPTTAGPGTDGPGTDPVTTEPVDPGTSTDGTSSTGPQDTTDGTSTGEPVSSSSSGADESSSSSTTTGPPETTTGDECEQQIVKDILLVADAQVMEPMEKTMSMLGEGMVARSLKANEGSVTFTVDLECEGTYSVWGRVLDQNPGVNNNDPDSYFVRVDDGPESAWFYGCQTEDLEDGYNWLRVRGAPSNGNCDDLVDVTPMLGAGTHTLRFRNREGATQNANAAIARIVVTNDPNYVANLPD